ncbi:hypothetical protein D3C79_971010 [compost metagenome]
MFDQIAAHGYLQGRKQKTWPMIAAPTPDRKPRTIECNYSCARRRESKLSYGRHRIEWHIALHQGQYNG